MEHLPDWLQQGLVYDLLKQLIMTFISLVLGWFLFVRRFLNQRQRLAQGFTDSVIFQRHRLIPIDGTDQVQLIFRNIAPNTTIEHLFENPAAKSLIRDLSRKTTVHNPILQTEKQAGFEVLNDAFSHVAGHLANTTFPRETWMFVMTSEESVVVRKTSIRCFLIKPEDLEKFRDWEWCTKNVAVEADSHWYRVVALHQIALEWEKEKQQAIEDKQLANSEIDRKAHHERIRPLSAGLYPDEPAIRPPRDIPWDIHEAFLKEKGVRP